MQTLSYKWSTSGPEHELHLLPVAGTAGARYLFGPPSNQRPIEIPDFYIMSTPVTRALWTHVMGSNPSDQKDPLLPAENVSWNDITGAGGFLERINASEIRSALAGTDASLRFRLPSETEWEYAARGGPHWTDGFAFSGSNNIDSVAWYGARFSLARRVVCRTLGWKLGWRLTNRIRRRRPMHTHPVALKAPNQIGLYDMCGNVWEWCEDACIADLNAIPRDGTPWLGPETDRRLRGGCNHNWDIHCTVWFRYGFPQDAHGGAIGFRPVLAPIR